MTIDALGFESQFIDHLAPVWLALPESGRGRFLVERGLVEHAAKRGIVAEERDGFSIRQQPQHAPVHDGSPALVASIGDIKVGRRLGYGPFVFLEHGAGQSYESRSPAMASYAGGPDRADNAVFLMPNEYSASRWRSAYPGARVEVVGSPRLDGLPRRQPGPTKVAITFHWAGVSAIPYSGNALGTFLPVLGDLAKAFDCIGHAHPRHAVDMERLYRRAGIPFVADFEDVCRQADVLAFDNTSVGFEFAATGRPVVVMNAEHWHRRTGPGLRFWDAAHVGVNADKPGDLIPAIERALEHRPEDVAAREDALEFVYAYRHGAAQRAADVVVDWLGQRQDVAA